MSSAHGPWSAATDAWVTCARQSSSCASCTPLRRRNAPSSVAGIAATSSTSANFFSASQSFGLLVNVADAAVGDVDGDEVSAARCSHLEVSTSTPRSAGSSSRSARGCPRPSVKVDPIDSDRGRNHLVTDPQGAMETAFERGCIRQQTRGPTDAHRVEGFREVMTGSVGGGRLGASAPLCFVTPRSVLFGLGLHDAVLERGHEHGRMRDEKLAASLRVDPTLDHLDDVDLVFPTR